ncbi:chaperonin family protein RbcX [Waterburya agarophytonicola K14]|uniref:Chaperonin family protein RbcX n=1 Tax=Waterburya agarophytonicola KI4 TaxID=2874699 RepID=A0A964BSI8_9CYAN|nr:chaperonin family protein RbcX [Waterburya agarophytonicola]MCC0177481.1 chaperonin family protein RbcX [Waterburya agarophytonicola KI4]
MQPKDIAKDTANIVQNYLTYKAVMLVIDQLAETNPGEAIWLRKYSSGGKLRDAEAYLEEIMSEPRGKELALRIMTVRDSIAEQTLEFLPEMVTSGIKQDNLTLRRILLERLTRSQSEISSDLSSLDEDIEPRSATEESSD